MVTNKRKSLKLKYKGTYNDEYETQGNGTKNMYFQINIWYLRLILTIGLLKTPIKYGLSTINSICGGGGNFIYVKKRKISYQNL